MAILILGGRGKTARRLASILSASTPEIPFLVASRTIAPSSPYKQAQFDWHDESTWAQPFTTMASASLASSRNISTAVETISSPIAGVYIVAPPIVDMVPPMKNPFERGGPSLGQVHDYLAELGEKGKKGEKEEGGEGIEWAVLRPTWFMENMSEAHHFLTIKGESKIYSATEDGRVPFVSAEDIARVAFRALTDARPHNTEHLILGPELLSYDDIAEILSSVLGRKVTHIKLSEAEFATRLESNRVSGDYAQMLAGLDTSIKNGAEDRMNDVVERVTAKAPRKFRDFAEGSELFA
ncbi:hypothetical protein EMCG_03321 [[Emmonsia] crescens]|uniref:NmrA-like domain-containing protein n=1 Tax=[Emmonsia] crescens TaxID=73230 RepID=A0A0G2HVT3_9EURO|nr:hypothetical protein EMCG_03321 [Emmonsia crescens UAMH 3008]